MGRHGSNMKQRVEEYERRTKTRKAEKIARLQAELLAEEDEPLVKEQMKIDAKNLLVAIILILFMLLIPSFESSRKNDIIAYFGTLLKTVSPLAEQGFLGILSFAAIVAIWDGISVVPIRYAEFLTALCFSTVPEYMVIMLIGKTLGGIITYKVCNSFIKNEDLEEVILSNGCSFYVTAISDLVKERPLIYGLIFRMFFPSIMNCIALALLPLNQTQFVFIQFLHALILSWPQAVLDYYPYIDKKIRMVSQVISSSAGNEHAEIIKRGIDSRMDIYKLGFLISQILALSFLTFAVLRRNRLLQAKFIGRVKLRLQHINREANIEDIPVSLTPDQLKTLGPEVDENDFDKPLEIFREKVQAGQATPPTQPQAKEKEAMAAKTTGVKNATQVQAAAKPENSQRLLKEAEAAKPLQKQAAALGKDKKQTAVVSSPKDKKFVSQLIVEEEKPEAPSKSAAKETKTAANAIDLKTVEPQQSKQSAQLKVSKVVPKIAPQAVKAVSVQETAQPSKTTMTTQKPEQLKKGIPVAPSKPEPPLKTMKKNRTKRDVQLLLDEIYSSTDEDYIDRKDDAVIATLVKNLIAHDEITIGKLISDDEKTIWRHTYTLLKETSQEDWSNMDSRPLRDKVNLCLGKLLLRSKKKDLTLQEACDQIERAEGGGLAGMASFLKTYQPIPNNKLTTKLAPSKKPQPVAVPSPPVVEAKPAPTVAITKQPALQPQAQKSVQKATAQKQTTQKPVKTAAQTQKPAPQKVTTTSARAAKPAASVEEVKQGGRIGAAVSKTQTNQKNSPLLLADIKNEKPLPAPITNDDMRVPAGMGQNLEPGQSVFRLDNYTGKMVRVDPKTNEVLGECNEREMQWVLNQQNNREIVERAQGHVNESDIEKELRLLKVEREARIKRNEEAKKAASTTTPPPTQAAQPRAMPASHPIFGGQQIMPQSVTMSQGGHSQTINMASLNKQGFATGFAQMNPNQPARQNPNLDQLIVKVVEGKLQLLRKDPRGNISQLSDEEVKKLNPKLTRMNDQGGTQGESISLTNGSPVPGYIAGLQNQSVVGGQINPVVPVNANTIPNLQDVLNTQSAGTAMMPQLQPATRLVTQPTLVRPQQAVLLPASTPTRITVNSANGRSQQANTGPIRLKLVVDSSGQRRLIPDMGPASDQN